MSGNARLVYRAIILMGGLGSIFLAGGRHDVDERKIQKVDNRKS